MIILIFLLLVANLVLTAAVAGSLLKMFNRIDAAEAAKTASTERRIRPPIHTVDLPVSRQPNYSDMVGMQAPSKDLKIIRDI